MSSTDASGGFTAVIHPAGAPPADAVASAAVIVQKRLDALGVSNSKVSTADGTLRVSSPVELSEQDIAAIASVGDLQFRPVLAVHPGKDSVTAATSGLIPLTPAGDVPIDEPVVLAQAQGGKEVSRYVLGPTSLTGSAVKSAAARSDDTTLEWVIDVTFGSGPQGMEGFNALTVECYDALATCPTRQTAIVLDGVVLSAPIPMSRGFSGDQIVISGGKTSESGARALAAALTYGALPFQVEYVEHRTS